MWTQIIITDRETGRKVHATIIDAELYKSGYWKFTIYFINNDGYIQQKFSFDKCRRNDYNNIIETRTKAEEKRG